MALDAAASRNVRARKAGMTTVVPPARTIVRMIATSPVTCEAGTASTPTSSCPSPKRSAKCMTEWTTPRCVSIAPLGLPVVPEV